MKIHRIFVALLCIFLPCFALAGSSKSKDKTSENIYSKDRPYVDLGTGESGDISKSEIEEYLEYARVARRGKKIDPDFDVKLI